MAAGRFQRLSVYGNDHPTPDGTGGQAYMHVAMCRDTWRWQQWQAAHLQAAPPGTP